jgi:hypothetical protein
VYDEMVAFNAFLPGRLDNDTDHEGEPLTGSTGVHKGLLFAAKYQIKTALCPSRADLITCTKGSSTIIRPTGDLPCYTSHYQGIAGPHGSPSAINPATGKVYGHRTNPRDGWSKEGIITFVGTINDNSAVTHVFPYVKPKLVTDGLSKTLMIGEYSGSIVYNDLNSFDAWVRGILGGQPTNNGGNNYTAMAKNVASSINAPDTGAANNRSASSDHPQGAHFAFGDGAVTFLEEDMDIVLYRALASRGGAENY